MNTLHTCPLDQLPALSADLAAEAMAGRVSLVTNDGRPLFITVPFDLRLLELGIHLDLAVRLFEAEAISLGKAARLDGLSLPAFMDRLAGLGIPIGHPNADELEQEIGTFG